MKLKPNDTATTKCAECEFFDKSPRPDEIGRGWCEKYQCTTRGTISVCEFRQNANQETLIREIEQAYQTWNRRIYHAREKQNKTTSKHMRRMQTDFWD